MEENLEILLDKKEDKGDYKSFEDIISRKSLLYLS